MQRYRKDSNLSERLEIRVIQKNPGQSIATPTSTRLRIFNVWLLLRKRFKTKLHVPCDTVLRERKNDRDERSKKKKLVKKKKAPLCTQLSRMSQHRHRCCATARQHLPCHCDLGPPSETADGRAVRRPSSRTPGLQLRARCSASTAAIFVTT